MPKKTYVNVGGTWRNVKTSWVKVAGVWRKSVPSGRIAGVWKEFIQYLFDIYNRGIENVLMVRGYSNRHSSSPGTITKEADYINVVTDHFEGDGSLGVVTNVPVDVTNYAKIRAEVSSYNSSSSGCTVFLTADKNKIVNPNFTELRTTKSNRFTNEIMEIDVSNVLGNYYIALHRDANNFTDGSIRIYRIWLE